MSSQSGCSAHLVASPPANPKAQEKILISFADTNPFAGSVFRAVNKGDRVVGDRIRPQAIYNIIVGYAEALEKKGVALEVLDGFEGV